MRRPAPWLTLYLMLAAPGRATITVEPSLELPGKRIEPQMDADER
jgi:hypothetical protein